MQSDLNEHFCNLSSVNVKPKVVKKGMVNCEKNYIIFLKTNFKKCLCKQYCDLLTSFDNTPEIVEKSKLFKFLFFLITSLCDINQVLYKYLFNIAPSNVQTRYTIINI